MTYQEKNKFEKIAEDFLSDINTNLPLTLDYKLISDALLFAKNKTNLNNYFLKNEYYDENVYSCQLFSEKIQNLKNINFKPKEDRNIIFWFKLYLCEKSFISIEEIKKII